MIETVRLRGRRNAFVAEQGRSASRDIGRALRTAKAVRTGMIAVNGLPSASSTSLFAPFGGYRRSGLGRELGMDVLAFYTEVKTVTVDLS